MLGGRLHELRQLLRRLPSVGLPELLEVVRSTGAQQPVMLGGLDWSRDLRGWLAHLPHDPADALVAANHTYDFSALRPGCRQNLARIARQVPVVTGELGEGDCAPPLHRPLHALGRPPRHLLPRLDLEHRRPLDLPRRPRPDRATTTATRPRTAKGFREHLRVLAKKRARARLRGSPS